MDKLRTYLNGLSVPQQLAFARKCKTSVGYLRKALTLRTKLGINLCVAIDRYSDGAVRCEDLRRDIDWKYLRGTAPSGRSRSAKAA